MSLLPTADQVALLTRQLERERRARRDAERVGEESTAQLYDVVQELRRTQERLHELVDQLSSSLRQDLDSRGILRQAVDSVGAGTGADRCLVRLADSDSIGPVVEQWTAPHASRLAAGTTLPDTLEQLCLAAARRDESLLIDDVLDDPRLSPADGAAVVAALGSRSYIGAPMWMGTQLVGWLVVTYSDRPRPWTARQLEVVESVAGDLGAALMQARAHAQQAEAVRHLEQVNRVKTEFVSTVSHELRTPLTSMNGYLELMSDEQLGPLTEEQHHALGVVQRNTDRLHDLVKDLLVLSQVDAGAPSSEVEEVDLGALLEDVVRAMGPCAATRGIQLGLESGQAVPPVHGQPEQLRRAFLNVLTNAVKFTPDRGSVSVGLALVGAHAVVQVVDTGHGVAEEDLPHVFDRFYRTSSAGERAVQGAGLGLAVVRSIVEQHQGTVTMTSVLDQGSTVTVTLPVGPAPSAVAVGVTDALEDTPSLLG